MLYLDHVKERRHNAWAEYVLLAHRKIGGYWHSLEAMLPSGNTMVEPQNARKTKANGQHTTL